MTKKITFNPISQLASLTVPPPKPAASYLPSWYKHISPFHTKYPEFCITTGRVNKTVKKCMPFFDSFQMGYIQETWQDIWIEKKDGETLFSHPTAPKIMTARHRNTSQGFPHVQGFLPNHFVWHPPWWLELPAGYSCIFTHPLNHDELPFRTFTGIVDCDSYNRCEPQSNIPFMLNQNFTGMIKKGTPMYQMIPFKRDSWESNINPYNEDQQISILGKVRQHFWDGYKKLHWKKKEFK
jgi:hypothetical protein